MNFYARLIGLLLCFTFLSAKAEDVDKTNVLIKKIVSGLILGDEKLYTATGQPKIEFLPETDISSNSEFKMKLKATAGFVNSAWKSKVDFKKIIGLSANEKKQEAKLYFGAEVATNTVLLMQYIGAEIYKSTCSPNSSSRSKFDPNGTYEKKVCDSLKDLASAKNYIQVMKSYREVFSTLTDLLKVAKDTETNASQAKFYETFYIFCNETVRQMNNAQNIKADRFEFTVPKLDLVSFDLDGKASEHIGIAVENYRIVLSKDLFQLEIGFNVKMGDSITKTVFEFKKNALPPFLNEEDNLKPIMTDVYSLMKSFVMGSEN